MLLKVQFVQGAGLGSDLIEWFEAGDLSHVDVVLPTGELLGARSDHIGGRPPGVQVRPAGYAKFRKRVVFGIQTTDAKGAEFWKFLLDQQGKPYDKLAIVGFAVGRNWREDDSWFCSELVARALEVAGILPPLYTPANKVPPAELATILSAIGALKLFDSEAPQHAAA